MFSINSRFHGFKSLVFFNARLKTTLFRLNNSNVLKINICNVCFAESSSAPVVRLSERESIVATSFLIEGEKAFCLTKSKQPSPPFSQQKITSRKEKIVFKPAKPKVGCY